MELKYNIKIMTMMKFGVNSFRVVFFCFVCFILSFVFFFFVLQICFVLFSCLELKNVEVRQMHVHVKNKQTFDSGNFMNEPKNTHRIKMALNNCLIKCCVLFVFRIKQSFCCLCIRICINNICLFCVCKQQFSLSVYLSFM